MMADSAFGRPCLALTGILRVCHPALWFCSLVCWGGLSPSRVIWAHFPTPAGSCAQTSPCSSQRSRQSRDAARHQPSDRAAGLALLRSRSTQKDVSWCPQAFCTISWSWASTGPSGSHAGSLRDALFFPFCAQTVGIMAGALGSGLGLDVPTRRRHSLLSQTL